MRAHWFVACSGSSIRWVTVNDVGFKTGGQTMHLACIMSKNQSKLVLVWRTWNKPWSYRRCFIMTWSVACALIFSTWPASDTCSLNTSTTKDILNNERRYAQKDIKRCNSYVCTVLAPPSLIYKVKFGRPKVLIFTDKKTQRDVTATSVQF